MACMRLAAADSTPTSALDKPAMTATAAELRALAKAAPAGADVDTLREDIEISLDVPATARQRPAAATAAGRCRRRRPGVRGAGD